MLIFKKQYEKATSVNSMNPEVAALVEEAKELVKLANKGVQKERSPITLIEKVQINDTVKLVEKLIIDISRGKKVEKNSDMLKKAVVCLKTSIENIL